MYDVIVVGAGVVGSATGYQLAKQGYKVLLIEQLKRGHSGGSSHGSSRIIRKGYKQDFYSHMMLEAFSEWVQLENDTQENLLIQCGLLSIAQPINDMIIGTISSLEKLHADFKLWSAREVKQQYPLIDLPDDVVAIFDSEAGILLADKCLGMLQRQFVHYGGCLHEEEPVLSIRPGHTVTVNTSKDSYQAKSVIITVGPWADKVLKPLGLNLPLHAELIRVLYWKQKLSGHEICRFPALIIEDLPAKPYSHVYALPAMEHPNHVKICVHNGPVIDPDSQSRERQDDIDQHVIASMIKKHFPGLEDKPSITDACLYTLTPDRNFVLDVHPTWSNIVIGAGMSGHGFKLAPVVGKILGELATGQTSSYDLSPFCIKRFQQSDIKANL